MISGDDRGPRWIEHVDGFASVEAAERHGIARDGLVFRTLL